MDKIKITRKLLSILKAYTKLYSKLEGEFHQKTYKLEKQMEKETGISEIEFFKCDGEFSGIGTPSCPEKMELVHRAELE